MSETVTMTLADFLLARIAEDEATARATASPVVAAGRGDTLSGRTRQSFVGRWQPSRALAECEAKRRIVALHVDMETTTFAGGPSDDWWAGWRAGMEPTLRALALPYADHPDYRQEWAS